MLTGLPKSDAGRSLTTTEQEPIRRYRVRFEVRDATTLATIFTDTLDSIVIDNRNHWAAPNLREANRQILPGQAARRIVVVALRSHAN